MTEIPPPQATASATPSIILERQAGLHHIVVVGGGAGGLELATQLGHKLGRKGRAHITLVDKTRTHIWKPLLHEIAAGSMDVERHALEYQAQGHWHGFKYRYGEMIGLDRANTRVHLAETVDEDGRQITPDRWLPYDTLVIAIGSVSNSFGTPGADNNAIMLDTPEQAERFNRRLHTADVDLHCARGHIGRQCLGQRLQPKRLGEQHRHWSQVGLNLRALHSGQDLRRMNDEHPRQNCDRRLRRKPHLTRLR